jgi:hypothetical protein
MYLDISIVKFDPYMINKASFNVNNISIEIQIQIQSEQFFT